MSGKPGSSLPRTVKLFQKAVRSVPLFFGSEITFGNRRVRWLRHYHTRCYHRSPYPALFLYVELTIPPCSFHFCDSFLLKIHFWFIALKVYLTWQKFQISHVSHYSQSICDIAADAFISCFQSPTVLTLTSPQCNAPLQRPRLAFMLSTNRKLRHSLGWNQQGLELRPLLEVFNCFKSNMRVQLLDLQHH